MEVSRYLRQHALSISGKSQLFMSAYAKVRSPFRAGRALPGATRPLDCAHARLGRLTQVVGVYRRWR